MLAGVMAKTKGRVVNRKCGVGEGKCDFREGGSQESPTETTFTP